MRKKLTFLAILVVAVMAYVAVYHGMIASKNDAEPGLSEASGEYPEFSHKPQPEKVDTFFSRKAEVDLIVNPTNELEDIRREFQQDLIQQQKKDLEMSEFRLRLLDLKQSGKLPWGAENWMLSRAEYDDMETNELAEAVFERRVVVNELMKQDNAYAFLTLETLHNAFDVLRGRDDMWKGILHMYTVWGKALRSHETSDLDFIATSLTLDHMSKFYGYPDFKQQIKGRELAFLYANLDILRAYQDLLNRQKPDDPLRFFGEACSVAQVALSLFAQTHPDIYEVTTRPIPSIRWPKEQRKSDLQNFLSTVIASLEKRLE